MLVNNEFSGHIVYREVTFVNILIFLEKDEGQKKTCLMAVFSCIIINQKFFISDHLCCYFDIKKK